MALSRLALPHSLPSGNRDRRGRLAHSALRDSRYVPDRLREPEGAKIPWQSFNSISSCSSNGSSSRVACMARSRGDIAAMRLNSASLAAYRDFRSFASDMADSKNVLVLDREASVDLVVVHRMTQNSSRSNLNSVLSAGSASISLWPVRCRSSCRENRRRRNPPPAKGLRSGFKCGAATGPRWDAPSGRGSMPVWCLTSGESSEGESGGKAVRLQFSAILQFSRRSS